MVSTQESYEEMCACVCAREKSTTQTLSAAGKAVKTQEPP